MTSVLEEKANFTRLCRLLVDKGTEALRITLDGIHPPANLPSVLNAKKATLLKLKPRVINNSQIDLLFPPSGKPPDSKTFDVTLLNILLRNICSLPPPAAGWDVMPPDTETSLQANIARIKLMRNKFYAHVPLTQVDKTTFEDLWQKISLALTNLKIPQEEINELKHGFLGPEEKNYVQIITQWFSEDNMLGDLTKDVKDLQQCVERLERGILQDREGKEELFQFNLRQSEMLLRNLAKHNFRGVIREKSELFHHGTREWLIKKVENWFTNEDESRCLLVKAAPGFGKSVFAAKVCQLFEKMDKLAACHFCQFSNWNLKDPKMMLQSLASHLCESIPGFKEKLLDQLNRPHVADSLCETFQIYLQNPLDNVEAKPKLIVIDGLDEITTDDKRDVVTLISDHFPALPTCVKVLVTSRPELCLKTLEHTRTIEIDVENEENRSDLFAYLKDCLPSLVDKDTPYPTSQFPEDYKRRILNFGILPAIVQRCEGSFQYAFHAQHELCKRNDLERMTIEEIMMFLPKGMRSVYKKYFDRLEMELEAIMKKRTDLHKLLELLVAANQSLPLKFVARILGLDLDCRETIKIINKVNDSVSCLLNVFDGEVTVFHKSVHDWLLASGDDAHEYSVNFVNGRRRLGVLCEQVFEEIKRTVVSGQELKLTYEIKHALYYGHMYLVRCKIKDSYYWLVDMIIIYVLLYYYPKNIGFLRFLWSDVLRDDEDFSLQVRQRISWHLIMISSIDDELMDLTPRCYLQIALDYSPKGCFTDKEREFGTSGYINRCSAVKNCLKPLLVKPFPSSITAVGVSSSKKLVAVAMRDGTLLVLVVYSLPTLVSLFQYSTDCDHISCCTFSPDDSFVLFGKLETALSTAEEKEVSFFDGEVERFKSCAFSPNGKRLVTNNHSRIVRVWDVGRKSLLCSLRADVPLECCSFSDTGLFIIGDTDDAEKDSYCEWNAITFQRVDCRGLMTTKDECRRSERCSRCCSQLQRERIHFRKLGNSTGVYNDMDCIFYLDKQKTLRVIESVHFTTLAAWILFIQKRGVSPIVKVMMIENNLWLCFNDEMLFVYISEQPKENQSCLLRPTRVLWCSFSPDGARLACCTSNGLVNLWSVDTSRIYQQFKNNPGTSCAACCWSERYLFVCHFDDKIPSLSKYPVNENFTIMVSDIVPVPLCTFFHDSLLLLKILDFSKGYISFACDGTKPVKVLEVSKMDNPCNVVLSGIRPLMSIAISDDASFILGTRFQCIIWKRVKGDPFRYTVIYVFYSSPLFCWCFSEDSKLAISFLPLEHRFAIIDLDNGGCEDKVVEDIAFTSYGDCVTAKLFCTNGMLVLIRSKLIEMFDSNSGNSLGMTFQLFNECSMIRSRLNPQGTNLAVPTLSGEVKFFRICHPRQ